jgi:outer membrane protein assembly factor BamB
MNELHLPVKVPRCGATCTAAWLLGGLLALPAAPAPAQTPSSAAPSVPSEASWPRFLGSTYDGVVDPVSDELDWTAKPAFVWSLEVGGGYGIGSIVSDRYFHFDAVEDPASGQLLERLRAIDLAGGQPVWSSTQPIRYRDLLGYEDGPRSSPTIDGDAIFTLGVTGLLTCRKLVDGKLRWTVDTNEKYGVVQNFFGVGSSPLVLGDRVIVMVGGSPPEDQAVAPMRLDRVSPNGSAVVAFDRGTGKELWRCGNDLASYSSPRPIHIDGQTLVLVFARSGLIAVDPQQGTERWKFDHRAEILESVNAIVPVIDGQNVLISECYEVGSVLLRVDGSSAAVLWQDPPRNRRAQAMRCHWATPVLVDGYLYGCSGRNEPDSDFRCIDFQTGEVQWTDDRAVRSSVVRAGDHLVVWEERGTLQILQANPQRLEVVSQWDLSLPEGARPGVGYPCWAAPILVGTKLLLCGDERVLCLDFRRH